MSYISIEALQTIGKDGLPNKWCWDNCLSEKRKCHCIPTSKHIQKLILVIKRPQ